jgi:hypothetical protein
MVKVLVYTWELNFGQTIWGKSEVLLKIFWGTIWNLGNLLVTLWEHDGNTLGMRKKQKIPSPARQEERTGPLMSALLNLLIGCMKLLFPRLCQYFWPGLLAGAQTVGHSSKMKSCCRHSSPWKVVIRVGLPLTNYSIVWWQKGFYVHLPICSTPTTYERNSHLTVAGVETWCEWRSSQNVFALCTISFKGTPTQICGPGGENRWWGHPTR